MIDIKETVCLKNLNSWMASLYIFFTLFKYEQIAIARANVKQEKEKLDLLIGLYRKQLKRQSLDFISVSGTTHLIEVIDI